MYMHFIWVIFQLSHSFYQHSWTIQQYLVCFCCWLFWMHKTLFQTWQRHPPPYLKEIILDSMFLFMGVPFNSQNKISNVQLYSLHDLNFQLCPSTSLRWIFHWCHSEYQSCPLSSIINHKMKSLLSFVSFLFKNDSVREFYPIRITLIVTYYW